MTTIKNCKVRKMKICKFSMLGIGLGISLLSGCTPEVAKWSPAESPKENMVDRAVFTYAFPYSAHKGEMCPLEKVKFLEFLKNTIPSPYAVKVTLEEYDGHSDKRLMDIERELLRFGVPMESIGRNYDHVDVHYGKHHHHKHHKSAAHHKAHPTGSVVLVVVERFFVITPSCANNLEKIGDASQAYSYSNLGCATEVNLGLMIANPQDLLRGRNRDPYDGTVMAAGVRRYETDKIKPIAEITTTTMQNQATSSGSSTGSGSTGSSGGGY